MSIRFTKKIEKLTIAKGFSHPCSIEYPCEFGITFATDASTASALANHHFPIFVFCAEGLIEYLPPQAAWLVCENPFFEWALVQNHLAQPWGFGALDPIVMPGAKIHRSAVLSEPGIRIAQTPTGDHIRVAHTGRVLVQENAVVGPHAVIHRALIDMTIIDRFATIGALCNVGHNCHIGSFSILAASVSVAGSVHIGEHCFVGVGASIRNGIRICDGVLIGAGAAVVKDITEPGKYVGNPARRIGEWDGRW